MIARELASGAGREFAQSRGLEQFLDADLPPVSIIRPTLTQNGGAVATIQSFISDNLFAGQSREFIGLLLGLAVAADSVQRGNTD